MVSERTAAIVEELHRRFPCQALPIGAQRELAKQFGVSPQWIQQIVNRYGFTGHVSTRTVTVCGRCGKEIPKGSRGLCFPCRWIELPCSNCGKPKRVRAAEIARRIDGVEKRRATGQPAYSGNVYCDRRCFGEWLGRNHGIQTRPQDHYHRRGRIAGT